MYFKNSPLKCFEHLGNILFFLVLRTLLKSKINRTVEEEKYNSKENAISIIS